MDSREGIFSNIAVLKPCLPKKTGYQPRRADWFPDPVRHQRRIDAVPFPVFIDERWFGAITDISSTPSAADFGRAGPLTP